MIKSLHKFILLVGILSSATEKLAGQDLTNTLTTCIKEGDVATLSEYFQATVDIGLPGKDQDYSKTQAEMVLKDFFKNYPCKDFKLESSGDSENQTFHIIGTYQSTQEKYQVLILLKKRSESEKMLIYKIKFEKKT
jgi:hypothetical protein